MDDRRKTQDTIRFQDRRVTKEADEDCNKGPTIVKFGLWPILMLIIMAIAFLYMANSQAGDRITRLETKFDFIASGVSDIKEGMKELAESLKAHEMRHR